MNASWRSRSPPPTSWRRLTQAGIHNLCGRRLSQQTRFGSVPESWVGRSASTIMVAPADHEALGRRDDECCGERGTAAALDAVRLGNISNAVRKRHSPDCAWRADGTADADVRDLRPTARAPMGDSVPGPKLGEPPSPGQPRRGCAPACRARWACWRSMPATVEAVRPVLEALWCRTRWPARSPPAASACSAPNTSGTDLIEGCVRIAGSPCCTTTGVSRHRLLPRSSRSPPKG